MSLTKVDYVNGTTVIMAENLNAIQDEIIANASAIGTQATAIQNLGTNKADVTALNAEASARAEADTTIEGELDDLKSSINRVVDTDADDVDLDLSDTSGNVIARFADGHVKTKKFNSFAVPDTALTDADASDLDVVDNAGNVLARLSGGHIKTKHFDSAAPSSITVSPTDGAADGISVVDAQGFVVVEFASGEINTKNFNSKNVRERLATAEDDISELQDSIGKQYVVPSYWIDYLTQKEAAINDLNMALDSGESFIFFTDYHQNSNNKNSAPLMRHIVDHTSITDVVYGGDTTDGGTLPTTQAAEAVVRAFSNLFKPLRIKPARGNHDCEPLAYQTVNQIPDAAWYDMMIRPVENDVVSGNELYFYYDNTNQKIRHIVMDSGGMNDALTETQLTWMKARLTELETGWTAIIFQHMVLESNKTEQTVHLITRGTKILNAIGDVYNSLNCTIAAFVCGHMHVDAIVDTDYNFKIIATTCDAGGANSASDWNNPTRPAGTTNEQAFDVYSIDTTNRTISITRIGAGIDRVVTY